MNRGTGAGVRIAGRRSRVVISGVLAALLAACGGTGNSEPVGPALTTAPPADSSVLPPSPALSAGTGAPGDSTCRPTDQDRYVYHPDRLTVLRACLRVSGTIALARNEKDGDLHILLRLDAPYAGYLTPANANERGDLVVEPVCVGAVGQADAVATCAADADPLTSLPSVGLHVWMEGRYVLDTQHGGWAELHPLYRWARLGS